MKYIFIDSNQYRHLFSRNEGFSDKIKEVIDRLISANQVSLLLPTQVKNEVERGRLETWFKDELSGSESRIKGFDLNIEKHTKNLSSYPKELSSIVKKIENEKVKEKKEQQEIEKRFRNLNSKANQKLKSLFERAILIEETQDIVYNARLRLEKGNPPNDCKLGDALIWESILSYLSMNSDKKSTLVFVARDESAWGFKGFHPWLTRELKDKANVGITLASKLSDIDLFTKSEQEQLKAIEEFESKNNALSNFTNSQSWVGAGENIDKLLQFKDILTSEDYTQIISASITNSEIYKSFFTSNKLNKICEGEKSQVVKFLENIDLVTWNKFVLLNQITLKRQVDIVNAADEIDPNDIPF